MTYFSKDFLKFFKDLEKNNTSEWFNSNRKVYEQEVKEPFKKLVDDLILKISKDDPSVRIQSKDAIHRINRDIRFSKDKTPYNTHVSANISKVGKKSSEVPGFYVHLSANKMMLGGGSYQPEKENLQKIRQEIAYNLKTFNTLIKDKNFVSKYGEIQGEKNKIIPKEFQEDFKTQPLLANKQFYYMAELKSDTLLRKDLMDVLMDHYAAGKKINRFLEEAMNG